MLVDYIKKKTNNKLIIRKVMAFIYHYFFFFLSRLFFKRIICDYPMKCVNDYFPIEMINCESYFGYYDKIPMNNNSLLLINVSSGKTNKLMNNNEKNYLLLLDLKKEEDNVLDKIKVSAYNWQQGSRAEWLSDDLFIFNDFCNEKYISNVYSVIKKSVIKKFDYPVQDSYKLEYFLSINYRRLQRLNPEYGYYNLEMMSDDELNDLENDGIWKIDYISGNSELLLSIRDVLNFYPNKYCINKAFHAVNHIMISPNGKYFIFIHRFYVLNERFDRLILSDKYGGLISVLADNKTVSHCCWVDDNTVLGYIKGNDNIDSFYLIDIISGKRVKLNFSSNYLYGDGHPSLCGDFIVSDSYPNKYWFQYLYIFNPKNTSKIDVLGRFLYSIKYQKECRCDLHPRAMPSKGYVFFDSTCEGKRKMYYIDINVNK